MRLLFILLVSGFLFEGCDGKKMQSEYLTNVSATRETEDANNARKTASSPTTLPNTPLNTPIATTKLEPTETTPSSSQYHIIVRSYDVSKHKEAQEMVKKLKAQGYPAMSINKDKRFRVSIEHFDNKAEADKACEEYRKITENNDIWVLHLK